MDYQKVTETVAGLIASTTEDSPLPVLLGRLTTATRSLLDVDGVHLMTTHEGRHQFVHESSVPPSDLPDLEEALRTGPAREATQTSERVVVHDASAFARWPRLAEMAARVGIESVLAVPMQSRGLSWGVLIVVDHRPTAWSADQVAVASLLANGATARLVVQSDRNEAMLAKIQLNHQSTHDPLTGLANRVLLFDHLQHRLAAAAADGTGVAAAFVDLDHFAHVNDAYGHRAGDHVLAEVAQRLVGLLRSGDMVARLGSDEFVVVYDRLPLGGDPRPHDAVRSLAALIHQALAEPVHLEAGAVRLTAHVGVAIASGSMTAEELVDEADNALFESIGEAPGSVGVRDFSVPTPGSLHAPPRPGLTEALEQQRLIAHYQPIVQASAPHTVAAVETLMRWTGPNGHTITATSFVDAAARQGLMPAFGAWIINEACAQLARWRAEPGRTAPRRVFVNLSARELNDPALPDTLAAAAERHELAPAQIGLEIVEESLVHPGLVHRLAELRRRGHLLAIDDFGTGYSSLSRLLEVPVDVVKVDHAFVAGIPGDRRRSGLVEAVVAMARALDVQVVAEGVETVEQRDLLVDVGVDWLQGYLFGRPGPGDRVLGEAGDRVVLVRHVLGGHAAVVPVSTVATTVRRWFTPGADDVGRTIDELQDALVTQASTRRLENYLGVEISRP